MLTNLLIINIILTIIAFIAVILNIAVLVEIGQISPFASASKATGAIYGTLLSFIVIVVVFIALAVLTSVPYIPLFGAIEEKGQSTLSESEIKAKNAALQKDVRNNKDRQSNFKWLSFIAFILTAGAGSVLFYPFLLINSLPPSPQQILSYQLIIASIVLFYFVALVSLGEFIYLLGPGKNYEYYGPSEA